MTGVQTCALPISLPPRSYFRFDPLAVEWERESREMLGEPLPPAETVAR